MPLRIFISILLILILKLNISPIEVSVELPFYKVSHKTVCGWVMPLNVFSKYLCPQVLLSCHRGSLRLTTVNCALLFRGKDLKCSVVMSSSEYTICRRTVLLNKSNLFFLFFPIGKSLKLCIKHKPRKLVLVPVNFL